MIHPSLGALNRLHLSKTIADQCPNEGWGDCASDAGKAKNTVKLFLEKPDELPKHIRENIAKQFMAKQARLNSGDVNANHKMTLYIGDHKITLLTFKDKASMDSFIGRTTVIDFLNSKGHTVQMSGNSDATASAVTANFDPTIPPKVCLEYIVSLAPLPGAVQENINVDIDWNKGCHSDSLQISLLTLCDEVSKQSYANLELNKTLYNEFLRLGHINTIIQ